MTDRPPTLDESYLRLALVVIAAIATLGVAILYSQALKQVEIDWLESIPVLAEDPDVADGPH